jgi:hypothetical protein
MAISSLGSPTIFVIRFFSTGAGGTATTPVTIHTGPSYFYGISVLGNATANAYVQIYLSATSQPVVGTTVPDFTIPVSLASSTGTYQPCQIMLPLPIKCASGIWVSQPLTTFQLATDTVAGSANNQMLVQTFYNY